jgi:hypothetical protein
MKVAENTKLTVNMKITPEIKAIVNFSPFRPHNSKSAPKKDEIAQYSAE